jgi:hypothetical protein
MKFISHRGNIDGKIPELENSPQYILEAINLGFEVEIDIWIKDNTLYLGHDMPQYAININWLSLRKDKIWIHCKNINALLYFFTLDPEARDFNYFWHQSDLITLTSKNYIWAFPGNQPINNSIAVLPEIYSDDVSSCLGICSDIILKYRHEKI